MSKLTNQDTPSANATFNDIDVCVYPNADDASQAAASEIATVIRQRAEEGTHCVLGLATGSTPVSVYHNLIRMYRDEGLSLRNVITFNLDEYFPMQPDAPQSYVRFMDENLFNHVDIDRKNIHIPDGTVALQAVDEHCRSYEDKIADAGGIDLQLLGIGRTGHIGFNEPGSDERSLTRMVMLNSITRNDAAGDFAGIENVPVRAITMGVQTILNARCIRLLAFGEHKSAIVQRTVQGEVSDSVPATFLQKHNDIKFLLDTSAATKLSSFEDTKQAN
jgi:glucosamine-6-phosphate deaminase